MYSPHCALLFFAQVALAFALAQCGLRVGWLAAVYRPTVPYHWTMALVDTLVPLVAICAVSALLWRKAGVGKWCEAALASRVLMIPLVWVVASLRPLVVEGLALAPDRFPDLLRLDQAGLVTWLAVAGWVLMTVLAVGWHPLGLWDALERPKAGTGRLVACFVLSAVLAQALVTGLFGLVW